MPEHHRGKQDHQRKVESPAGHGVWPCDGISNCLAYGDTRRRIGLPLILACTVSALFQRPHFVFGALAGGGRLSGGSTLSGRLFEPTICPHCTAAIAVSCSTRDESSRYTVGPAFEAAIGGGVARKAGIQTLRPAFSYTPWGVRSSQGDRSQLQLLLAARFRGPTLRASRPRDRGR